MSPKPQDRSSTPYIQGTLSSSWLGVRNLGLQTGPKPSTKNCLTVNVGCARLPLNDCTHRLDAHLDYNAKGQ